MQATGSANDEQADEVQGAAAEQQGENAVEQPQGQNRAQRARGPLPARVVTLVIRNLPWAYCMGELMQEWPPDGSYEYFSVPYNWKNRRIVGYAFMSFATHGHAAAFYQRWHGSFLALYQRAKPLDIAAADKQGWRANLGGLAEDVVLLSLEAGVLPIALTAGQRWTTQKIFQEIAITQALLAFEGEDAFVGSEHRPLPHNVPLPVFVVREHAPLPHDVTLPVLGYWSL